MFPYKRAYSLHLSELTIYRYQSSQFTFIRAHNLPLQAHNLPQFSASSANSIFSLPYWQPEFIEGYPIEKKTQSHL